MKKVIALIIPIIWLSALFAAKPVFFITYEIKGDSSGRNSVAAVPQMFITEMSKELLREFPCIDNVMDVSTASQMIGFERKKKIIGTPEEFDSKEISGIYGSDYLVSFKIQAFPNGSSAIKLGCIDTKLSEKEKGKSPVIANITGQIRDIGEAGAEVMRLVKKLSEELTYYEICPYKGPVRIEVLTEQKEETKEEYDVYCSKADRKYKKTTLLDKKSSSEWNLDRIRKESATGTIKHSMAEKTEIDEQDECYKCEPMITGIRNYSDITTGFMEIDGIARGPENEQYAIIQVNFSKNGTYTLSVKAASEIGDLHTMRMEKATGECQTFETPAVNSINKSNVGIRETLGPFKGTGKDKVLQEKQTIEKTDPQTKEKTTITYDFNLRRD